MAFYARTSRNTGVSLPWWLAIPAILCYLLIMLAVLMYAAAAVLVVWLARAISGWVSKRQDQV